MSTYALIACHLHLIIICWDFRRRAWHNRESCIRSNSQTLAHLDKVLPDQLDPAIGERRVSWVAELQGEAVVVVDKSLD